MKISYSVFVVLLPFVSLGYLYDYLRNWAVNGSIYPLIGLCGLMAIKQLTSDSEEGRMPALYVHFLRVLALFLALTTTTTIIMSIYVDATVNSSAYEPFKQPLANSLKVIPRDLVLMSCFLGVFAMNRSSAQIRFTLKLLVVSFFLVLCYGYVQVLGILGIASFRGLYEAIWPWIDAGWAGSTREAPYIFGLPPRVNLTMPEASEVAHYFQVALYPFLLAAMVSRRSLFARTWLNCSVEAIVFLLSLPVLLFTFSSAGYVVLLAQILVSLILYVRYHGVGTKTLGVLSVITAGLALGIAALFTWNASAEVDYLEIIGKLFGVENGSSNTRYALTLAGFRVFLSYPLFGVGPANTNLYMERFLPDWSNQNYEILNAIQTQAVPILNYWVDMLASFGLAGTATYVYLMYVSFRPVVAMRANSQYRIFVKTAAYLYLCGTIMHGFNSSSSSFIYLWAIWAVFVCLVVDAGDPASAAGEPGDLALSPHGQGTSAEVSGQ